MTSNVPPLNLARLRARTRARAKTDSALVLPTARSASADGAVGSDEDTPPLDTPPRPQSDDDDDDDDDALFVPTHWDTLPPTCYNYSGARHGFGRQSRRASLQLGKRRSWRLSGTSGDTATALTPRTGVSSLWQRADVAQRNTDTLTAYVAGRSFGWTALQNAARCGFGAAWRGLMWSRLAGAATRGPLDLRVLVRARGVARRDYAQLCTDVLRAIDAENTSAAAELALYQLLLAFCAHNPALGYAQGMNMVGGALVVNIDDAAARFWLMDHVAHRVLPHYWRESWLGARADQRVLRYFLHNQRPRLAQRLDALDPEQLFARHIVVAWFSTLYATVLRADCVYWLWDMVLVRGAVVLFELTLRLVIARADLIDAAHDTHSLFLQLSDYLGALHSLDPLLAIKLPKTVGAAEIEARRAAALAAVLAEDVGAVPAADARGCACVRPHASTPSVSGAG